MRHGQVALPSMPDKRADYEDIRHKTAAPSGWRDEGRWASGWVGWGSSCFAGFAWHSQERGTRGCRLEKALFPPRLANKNNDNFFSFAHNGYSRDCTNKIARAARQLKKRLLEPLYLRMGTLMMQEAHHGPEETPRLAPPEHRSLVTPPHRRRTDDGVGGNGSPSKPHSIPLSQSRLPSWHSAISSAPRLSAAAASSTPRHFAGKNLGTPHPFQHHSLPGSPTSSRLLSAPRFPFSFAFPSSSLIARAGEKNSMSFWLDIAQRDVPLPPPLLGLPLRFPACFSPRRSCLEPG